MALNLEELNKLNDFANSQWGFNSDQFKNTINTKYWEGAYDKIRGQLQQQQTNIQKPTQNVQTPAPVQNVPQNITPQTAQTTPQAITTPAQQNITPEVKKEPVSTQTVKTQTQTPSIDWKNISIADWKKQTWWWLTNLDQLVENKYGVMAEQVNWWLEAVINWEKFRWDIDNAWNPIRKSLWSTTPQMDEEWIFWMLKTWQQVDKNLPWYKNAQDRINNYNYLTKLTDQQLQQVVKAGYLLPGTTEYNDLQQDPIQAERLKKIQQLNTINRVEVDPTEALESKSDKILSDTVNVNWQNITIWQALEDDYISWEELDKFINSPWIKAKETERLKRADEVAKKKAEYEAIEADVEKELEWSWATTSAKNALIAIRQKALLWPLNLAIDLYNNLNWEITKEKEQAMWLFKTNLELYQNKQTAEAKQKAILEERAYNTQQTAEERKYNAEQQRIERQTTFDNQKELLALQQEYKNQDTPTQLINVWNKQVLINTQTWEAIASYDITKETNTQDWAKLDDWTLYNQRTGQFKTTPTTSTQTTWWWASIVTTNPQSIVDYSTSLRWRTNLQCWELVNDYVKQITWSKWAMWDTYVSKIQAINKIWKSNWPTEWWVFAFQTKDQVWHTWIVQKVNPDWSITVLEANREWSKAWTPPTIRNYSKASVDKMHFSQNVIPKASQDTSKSTDSNIIAYNSATPSTLWKIANTPEWKKVVAERNKIFSDPNAKIEDILRYSQGWARINATAEQQLTKYQQALESVWDLQKNINNINTWPILWIIRSNNPYDVKAKEIQAQLSALIPNLARWVYWEVWVLTDNDIANYAKTVPNLKSTKDVNNLILSMTLKWIANWYKSKLQSLASAKYDVAWYEWIYKNIDNKVNSLLKPTTTTPANVNKQDVNSVIKAYFD